MKNTTVTLDDYFDNFISATIQTGRYKNASEVMRAALRLLENEENKIYNLKNAINEGAESGICENFDAAAHLVELKQKHNV